MTQQRDHPDPLKPPGADEQPTDPGGYIGHEPELALETIPGGVQRGDVRISGVATQPAPRGQEHATGDRAPQGHHEGSNEPASPREA
jgi:hypothetical protein